jgi:hypothetical protein
VTSDSDGQKATEEDEKLDKLEITEEYWGALNYPPPNLWRRFFTHDRLKRGFQ